MPGSYVSVTHVATFDSIPSGLRSAVERVLRKEGISSADVGCVARVSTAHPALEVSEQGGGLPSGSWLVAVRGPTLRVGMTLESTGNWNHVVGGRAISRDASGSTGRVWICQTVGAVHNRREKPGQRRA